MSTLVDRSSIESLVAVAGVAGAERLFARFQERLAAGLGKMPGLPPEDARSEAHSLRGSALLLGMIALADALLVIEEGGGWSAHERTVRELADRSVAELKQLLKDHS